MKATPAKGGVVTSRAPSAARPVSGVPAILRLALALGAGLSLGGCTALIVTGAVVGTAAATAGAVVSTGVGAVAGAVKGAASVFSDDEE